MIIKSLELADFRNYDSLHIDLTVREQIFYMVITHRERQISQKPFFLSATTKSHKGSKDKDIVNFAKEEAHIRTYLEKDEVEIRVDMHLRKSKTKGIAIDGQKDKKRRQNFQDC